MLKLLWALIKMTFRNRQALFWTLAFPTMFIVIFGLFDFENMGSSHLAFIDKADNEISQQFKTGLEEIEFLTIDQVEGEEDAQNKLREGDLDFILIIPEEFVVPIPTALDPTKLPVEMTDGQPVNIKIFYDEGNVTTNQLVLSVFNQFIDGLNKEISQTPEYFAIEPEAFESKNIKYIDVIMPGILGMAIMMASIIGIASEITKYREQRLLKRLTATPLKVRNFLIAEVLSYLIVAAIQITLIILVARLLYDVQIFGSYLYIYLLSFLGTIIFLNLGFSVAGWAKSVNAAESMSNVIAMPMMFLSGVFFSPEMLPSWAYAVTKYLPLSPLIEALREIANNGAGLADVTSQLGIILIWVVVTFLIAWKSFRFDKNI
ncbi:ABC transporter permease [Patescibacteria group bacterium]|nr:ABC transporter permease [Patescibacteria group bacterium]